MPTTNLSHYECKIITCPSGCGNWVLLNVIWDIKLLLLLWPEKTTPSDQCTFWSGSWSTAVQKLWWIRNCLYVVLQRAPLVLLEWVTVCGFVFGGRVKAEKVWKWSLMFNYLVCLNFHGNNDWHFKAWEPLFYPRPWDKRYSWKTAAYLSTYPLKTICLIKISTCQDKQHFYSSNTTIQTLWVSKIFFYGNTFIQQGHLCYIYIVKKKKCSFHFLFIKGS